MKTLWAILVLCGCTVASASDNDHRRAYTFNKGVNIVGWLTCFPEGEYADPGRFNERDVEWIAGNGFDHIRIPVNGAILAGVDGKLIAPMLQPLDRALSWAATRGLGVVVDLHILPGVPVAAGIDEADRWTEPAWRDRVTGLWAEIARRYI